ncbi:MAG TPA: ATP-dependent DNA helicase RecG [Gammaproteobacteria bacterium]|nr:ATP-dependent DNA helicase RecG [Gammaproteobacteria bacterium]
MKESLRAQPVVARVGQGRFKREPLTEQPVATLRGVGSRVAERLERLGVFSIGDLLCLLPARYEDRTQIPAIGSIAPGQKVLVHGVVELSEVVFRRRRTLLCRIADGTGSLTLRFFHFSRAQHEHLARGARIGAFGEVRLGPTGLEMVHPEYSLLGAGEAPVSDRLTPVYPTTEGLHQQRLRGLVEQALGLLERSPLADPLQALLPSDWPTLEQALRVLHGPPQDVDKALLMIGRHPCQRRLALEELVAQRLSLLEVGRDRALERAAPLRARAGEFERFREHLGFTLTRAQERVLEEIVADLGTERPMHRLLQGDVGCGKTVVAAFAALIAANAGAQTAVMVPTELLAEQHFRNFSAWLEPVGIGVTCLTSSLSATSRSRALEAIESRAAAVAIGTHALFQEAVRFDALGLVIVDEQHRFGVHQRLALMMKAQAGDRIAHQLVMTATPIPRTLAMTAYADLDCSIIDELPPGRQPVRTTALPESRRPALLQRVEAHCRTGQQAYWVCPLIEESESVDSQAAEQLYRDLQVAVSDLRVGLLHGRMRPADKEAVMRAFKAGELDLLVATTVIEVGVDVPNATLMVIENAERLGLAQLHQLRGRVGRGREASNCVLLYKPPLSQVARERLGVMRETTDGFKVAQKDLELRGPGEVLGTRQTGLMQLKVADLLRDADLLPKVIELSDALLARAPADARVLVRRWHSGQMRYAKV